MSNCNATQRVSEMDADGHWRVSEGRWQALPVAIHAAFGCTKKTPMHASLQALGVADVASRTMQRVYESEQGPPVVTVWLDQIERDADDVLTYWIDAFDWRPRPQVQPAGGGARMEAVLRPHVGDDVYVLLLKLGPGDEVVVGAPCSAPDSVRWTLESAGQSWFVLRRPAGRRVA